MTAAKAKIKSGRGHDVGGVGRGIGENETGWKGRAQKEVGAKQVIWGSTFEAAGKAAESPKQESAWP